MRFCSESGQSTVEAAILLPMLFALLGVLLQPAILLYSHCIMNAAAVEGCRLAATSNADETALREYVERRLGAIPKTDIFHMGKGWTIDIDRGDAGTASMSIANTAQPLPLLGLPASLVGMTDDGGNIEQAVQATSTPVPNWIIEQGYTPSSWIGAWK